MNGVFQPDTQIEAHLFNQADIDRLSCRYSLLVLRHIILHLFTSKRTKKSKGKQNFRLMYSFLAACYTLILHYSLKLIKNRK